jgi:hypothetical protein
LLAKVMGLKGNALIKAKDALQKCELRETFHKVHSKSLFSVTGVPPMSASPQSLDAWLDKQDVVKDTITAFPLAALAATGHSRSGS